MLEMGECIRLVGLTHEINNLDRRKEMQCDAETIGRPYFHTFSSLQLNNILTELDTGMRFPPAGQPESQS